MSKTLHRINLSYACFGVQSRGGVIVQAAPIGKWMVGKTVKEMLKWVKSKKGTVETIDDWS